MTFHITGGPEGTANLLSQTQVRSAPVTRGTAHHLTELDTAVTWSLGNMCASSGVLLCVLGCRHGLQQVQPEGASPYCRVVCQRWGLDICCHNQMSTS